MRTLIAGTLAAEHLGERISVEFTGPSRHTSAITGRLLGVSHAQDGTSRLTVLHLQLDRTEVPVTVASDRFIDINDD